MTIRLPVLGWQQALLTSTIKTLFKIINGHGSVKQMSSFVVDTGTAGAHFTNMD